MPCTQKEVLFTMKKLTRTRMIIIITIVTLLLLSCATSDDDTGSTNNSDITNIMWIENGDRPPTGEIEEGTRVIRYREVDLSQIYWWNDEEYLVYLSFFIAREPELIDGEFVYPPYEASVEYAFPVNDREENRIHQRFEESVFQRSVSLFGTHGANERFAFRDMLANGAREKYLGIAPPVSGRPPLATE